MRQMIKAMAWMGVVCVAIAGCGSGKLDALTASATCTSGVNRLRSCLAQTSDCESLEPILWELCAATHEGDDGSHAIAQCQADPDAQDVYAFLSSCPLDPSTCACMVEHPATSELTQQGLALANDGSEPDATALASMALPSVYGQAYGTYYPTGYYYPCRQKRCRTSARTRYYYPAYQYHYAVSYTQTYRHVSQTYYTCTHCRSYTWGTYTTTRYSYYYPTSYYYNPTYDYYYYPSGYYRHY